MATILIKDMGISQFGGVDPAGNLTTYRGTLATIANGSAVNAVGPTLPIVVTDKIRLSVLPAGMVLETATIVVSNGMSAGVTGSLGFEYIDGFDSVEVPQDAAYFGSGIALSTAARLANASTKALVQLPKEAFLILTIAGAANAKASRLDVIVHGERLGS